MVFMEIAPCEMRVLIHRDTDVAFNSTPTITTILPIKAFGDEMKELHSTSGK